MVFTNHIRICLSVKEKKLENILKYTNATFFYLWGQSCEKVTEKLIDKHI